jgi:hypothetical protein
MLLLILGFCSGSLLMFDSALGSLEQVTHTTHFTPEGSIVFEMSITLPKST